MNAELFDAIARHDVARLAELLLAGADPNAMQATFPKFTALQAAIEELETGGPLEALTLLLDHGADVDGWDEDHDATPLLMAVFRDQPAAVELLLAAGANPNVRGAEGDSPLRWCAGKDDLVMAKRLLEHGAGETIDEVGGERGMTALGLACSNLSLPMVELLLEAGANPNTIDESLRTPLERLPPRTRENAATWNKIRDTLEK
ncbi:ankyrin repeat domain-containing protein [Sorangium sp. So ce388]|uniref:ankyrin repeat domain-containing protein n=1 Tax=Sorangium sp. So ce388 TaxID=3133309 RepID=UPI003F5AF738